MLNYLMEIVDILYKTEVNHNTSNGKRIVSVLALMCCFKALVYKPADLPAEYIKAQLSMLRVLPQTQEEHCVEWNIIKESLPETMRSSALDAIRMYIQRSNQSDSLVWLFALPITHFLRGMMPFHPMEYNPRKIQWGDDSLSLSYVRSLNKDKDLG